MKRQNFHFPGPKQSGVVLITALVMLVILTMLGLASMGTNIMEERMAGNSQEINRAFQTAESGLELAFADVDSFSINNTEANPNTGSDNDIGTYSADANYSVAFRQQTIPKRGSGWDGSFAFYHFDLTSTGTTDSGAYASLHAGAYQVGAK